MTSLRLSVAAIGFATLLAAPASAVTCGNVTYGLIQDGTALAGVCSPGTGSLGNDTPTNVNAVSPGGISSWILADKSDGGGDQSATFALPVPASGQTTWAVLNPDNYPSILVTLKQGNSFAAFVLDMTKALSGTWSTSGPGGSSNDLSHGSVFVDGTPAPIPVPAAGLLLASAIGGIAVLRRRKRA
jgi:hypothetical protein